jgi:hypothetical protein
MGGWRLEIITRQLPMEGFVVRPWCWIVERTLEWVGRQRCLSKDSERKVQTSESLLQLAMIRLMVLWETDAAYTLRRLSLVCPKVGALTRESVAAYWAIEIPHPTVSRAPATPAAVPRRSRRRCETISRSACAGPSARSFEAWG